MPRNPPLANIRRALAPPAAAARGTAAYAAAYGSDDNDDDDDNNDDDDNDDDKQWVPRKGTTEDDTSDDDDNRIASHRRGNNSKKVSTQKKRKQDAAREQMQRDRERRMGKGNDRNDDDQYQSRGNKRQTQLYYQHDDSNNTTTTTATSARNSTTLALEDEVQKLRGQVRSLSSKLSAAKETKKYTIKQMQTFYEWSQGDLAYANMIMNYCKNFLFPRIKFFPKNWLVFDTQTRGTISQIIFHKFAAPEDMTEVDCWTRIVAPAVIKKYTNIRNNMNKDCRVAFESK